MQSLRTELNDRILRFDGISIIEPELAAKALVRGIPPSALRVSHVTEEIALFNAQVTEAEQILEATDHPVVLTMDWLLPESYQDLDLDAYVLGLFESKLQKFAAKYSEAELEEAIQRLDLELHEVKRRGMSEFLKTIIYILDTFRANDQVWGVGRGSSCACYILYVLGLHSVDCIRHQIPMTEFFHD